MKTILLLFLTITFTAAFVLFVVARVMRCPKCRRWHESDKCEMEDQ